MPATRPPRTLILIAAGGAGLAVLAAIFLIVAGRSSAHRPLTERMPKVASRSTFTDEDYRVPAVILVIAKDGKLRVGRSPRRWKTLSEAPSGDGDEAMLGDLPAAIRRAKYGKPKRGRASPADIEPKGYESDSDYDMVRPPDPDGEGLETTDNGDPTGRQASVHGKVGDDVPYDIETLIVAHPEAPATVLIDVLGKIDAAIAVAYEGQVHPLRVTFQRQRRERSGGELLPWPEIRFAAGGLDVEAVPDQAIHVALPLADVTALVTAYNQARDRRDLLERHDVDVLVAPDTTVQQLIDVMVDLTGSSVEEIGLGRVPAAGSPAATRRGKRVPIVHARYQSGDYGVDRATLQVRVDAQLAAMTECYKTALAGDPTLKGDTTAFLSIAIDNTVTPSTEGFTPDMTACLNAALAKVEAQGDSYETLHATFTLVFRN